MQKFVFLYRGKYVCSVLLIYDGMVRFDTFFTKIVIINI